MNMRVAELDYANQEFANELVPIRAASYKKSLKKNMEKVAKRGLDIIGGLVGVIFLLPLTFAIYIANRVIGDKGPIFYTQQRIGKNGKLFKMYKYRSMVVGADEKLEKYLDANPEAREEFDTYKKLKNDPRITKVGKFIRKTSLDEFPQFINVLKGDMSLVGPRPYLPREKEDMKYYYPYIVESKPGITGFWQVSGRSEVSFEERLNMDFTYFKVKNFKLDVRVLIKTFMNVVKREGAI